MTTPPVPQWAVDAAKRIWEDPGGSSSLTEMAKLIAAHAPQGTKALPDIIYEGYSVWEHLTQDQRRRTSPENVSDTLDALARADRAAIDAARQKDL